jgi:hypothetical protein
MSRGRTRSYTDRLHQRTAAPRAVKERPAWLAPRPLAAAAAVLAELGHLAAAVLEWPDSLPRGMFHVLAAAALGLLAASVYFGQSRAGLVLGIALTVFLPLAWLAGALFGISPYQHQPGLASAATAALEVGAAGLLTTLWRQS